MAAAGLIDSSPGAQWGSGQGSLLLLETAVFKSNIAGSEGGALSAYNLACLGILDSSFQQNNASSGGGAIFKAITGRPADCLSGVAAMQTNTAVFSASSSAGAANPDIRNTSLESNIASPGYGGGMLALELAQATAVTACQFDSNTAGIHGGGAAFVGTEQVTVSDTNFTNNACQQYGRGAVPAVSHRLQPAYADSPVPVHQQLCRRIWWRHVWQRGVVYLDGAEHIRKQFSGAGRRDELQRLLSCGHGGQQLCGQHGLRRRRRAAVLRLPRPCKSATRPCPATRKCLGHKSEAY